MLEVESKFTEYVQFIFRMICQQYWQYIGHKSLESIGHLAHDVT